MRRPITSWAGEGAEMVAGCQAKTSRSCRWSDASAQAVNRMAHSGCGARRQREDSDACATRPNSQTLPAGHRQARCRRVPLASG